MDTLFLELDSDRSEIQKVEQVLAKINEKIGFSHERFINLQIAVSEAMVNAIVHGNKEDENKKVHVIVNYDPTMVEVKVKDQGPGFDIGALPDPTNEENLLKESGRGVFIIMSLVDEFSCDYNDSGTELSLIIRRRKKQLETKNPGEQPGLYNNLIPYDLFTPSSYCHRLPLPLLQLLQIHLIIFSRHHLVLTR